MKSLKTESFLLGKFLLFFLVSSCIFVSQCFASAGTIRYDEQTLIIIVNDLQGQPVPEAKINIAVGRNKKDGIISNGKVQFNYLTLCKGYPITIKIVLNGITEEIITEIPTLDSNDNAKITITPSAGWFKSTLQSNVFI